LRFESSPDAELMDVHQAGGGAAASKVESFCARTIKLRCACSVGACLWVLAAVACGRWPGRNSQRGGCNAQLIVALIAVRSAGGQQRPLPVLIKTQHTHTRHAADFTRQEADDGLGRICASPESLIPLHVRICSGTCMEKPSGVFLPCRVRVKTNDPDACRNARHSV
jgi:hypothetical protein